jgi:hypothetical protein
MRSTDEYSDDWDRRNRLDDRDDYDDRRRGGWSDEDDDAPRRRRRNLSSIRRRGSTYPLFCKVIFIIDIVFCSLRLVAIPFGLFGYIVLRRQNPNDPMLVPGIFELLTNLGIGVLGILAASLMLGRKRIGIVFAGLTFLAVLGSFIVGLWQGSLQMEAQNIPPGSPQSAAMWTLLAGVLLIRLALLGLYIGALVVFLRMPEERRRREDRRDDEDDDRGW